MKLSKVIEVVAKMYKDDPTHPHTILAKLRAPIYLNASPDDLLQQALILEGAHPITVFSIWKKETAVPVVAFDEKGKPALRARQEQ